MWDSARLRLVVQVPGQGPEIGGGFIGGQADQGGANPDDCCTRVEVCPHIVGAAHAAAADDGHVRHGGDLAHALQADGQDALAGDAAVAVAEHRVAVGGGVSRPHGIDGAQAVGATGDGRGRDLGDIGCIGGELGNDRDVHHRLHRGSDLAHQFRVLAHGHAVAGGVRAGQVQLQAVRDRRQDLRHLDKLLDTAAEDGREQEAVRGHLQLRHQLGGLLRTGVGQSHGVDEAARRILAQHRLAVTQARLEADTLGGDHPHFRHMVEDILDDGGRGGDDTGGDGKGTREGFAEKVCIQGCGLGVRVTGRTSILVWFPRDDLAPGAVLAASGPPQPRFICGYSGLQWLQRWRILL